MQVFVYTVNDPRGLNALEPMPRHDAVPKTVRPRFGGIVVDDSGQWDHCRHADDARELQEYAYELGLIPFVPATRGDTDGAG